MFRQLEPLFIGERESFLDRVLDGFAKNYPKWREEILHEQDDVEGRNELIALLHWNMVYLANVMSAC